MDSLRSTVKKRCFGSERRRSGPLTLLKAGLFSIVIIAGGVRIFATHGHLFNVKYDPSLSELVREAKDADVVLFGHTHSAHREKRDGMEILNPGSIGRGARPSYGVIMICDGEIQTEIRYLE